MKIKQNLTKIIFIFLCLFTYINSDDEVCTCSVDNSNPFTCTSSGTGCNCKFKYPNDCVNCNNNDFDSDDYYSIFSGVCSNTCLGNKIIEITKECTSEDIVDSLYKLGDVFYNSDPSVGSTEIECDSTTYICNCKNYFYIQNENGKQIYNCVSNIPSSYSYINSETGELLQNRCPEGLKVTKSITISGSTVTRCSSSCSSGEYYSSEMDPITHILSESCSDSCNKKTYIVNGVKKCVNCEDINLYELGNNCVGLEKCDYYSETKCYTDCSEHNTNKYHNFGSKECILECTDEYLYKDEDTTNKKICYKKEQCNYIDTTNKICYSSCPTSGADAKSYHNYDSNICITDCTSNNNDKLYHNSIDKICYPSCLAIPEGNYIYEFDNYLCKNALSTGECSYYHIKNDGVKRCLSQSDCISKGYTYFVGQECRDSCDGYYKMSVETSGTPPSSFTQCYEDLAKVKADGTIKFYNIKSKLAWKTFPSTPTYYINNEIDDSAPHEIVEECEKYYYKNSDNNYYCIDKCSSVTIITGGYFFVAGNKKCESACTEFTINKYYYDPDNNECVDSCKGRNKGYQNTISTTSQACLGSCDEISNKFYNYDSNICMNACEGDKLYHKEDEKICYPSCLSIPDHDYIYELDNNICKNSDSDCTYYYSKNDGTYRCTTATNCKNYNKIYLIGKQCTTSCDDYYKYEDGSVLSGSTFINCFLSPDNCLTYFTTKNIATIVYYSENLKKCWTSNPNINTYFIEEVDNSKYKLIEECEKFYYLNGDGNYYCIDSCGESGSDETQKFFVSGQKKCSDDCINFGKKYYDPSNNECLDTCKGRATYGTQIEISNPSNAQKCLSNCQVVATDGTITNYYYYNYDSYLCLNKCGADGSNKKYHAYQGYICYISCLEIPDGTNGKYEYLWYDSSNNDYICITSSEISSAISNSCPYYYVNNDGVKVCQTASDCYNANRIYIEGNECKDQCDFYKFNFQDGSTSLIKCFSELNGCKNEVGTTNNLYYNKKLKKCWSTYQSEFYILSIDSTNKEIELVEECEHYYYIDTSTTPNEKHCKEECFVDTDGKFFLSGKKNCEDSCSPFHKQYYNPTNNECLDTCIGLDNLEFANKIVSSVTQEKCRNKCNESGNDNNKYYESGTNICIGSCASSAEKKYHALNDYVCYKSCAEIPGGEYIYEKDNICYKQISDISSGSTVCTHYYFKTNGDKQCATESECLTKKYKYFFYSLNQNEIECKESCDGYYKIELLKDETDSTSKFIKCFDTIETALSDVDVNYCNKYSKQCWKNYPNEYFRKEEITTGKYAVVEECEKFYYEVLVTDVDNTVTARYYDCIDSCSTTSNKKFFVKDKKNCEAKCTDFHKYYYDPEKNECLDTCKGRNNKEFADEPDSDSIYKCKNECLTNSFYDYDSNICISSCGSGNSNYLFHTKLSTESSSNPQDKICYPSCKDIPGDNYIYEYSDTDNIKICSTSAPASGCTYYFREVDGTLKCLGDDVTTACTGNKFNYLLGSECRSECNDFFILENVDTSGLIRCFETKEDCSNAVNAGDNIYYNIKTKKCWKTFPSGYFLNEIDDTNHRYGIEKECEKFYYKDSTLNQNHCIDKCTDLTPKQYFVKGQKNCETSCTVFHKYYYDTNNECLDTCEGKDNLEFADYIDFSDTTFIEAKPCKAACDTTNQHYNYGTKICLNSADCDGDNKYKKNGESKNICYNSCSDIPDWIIIFEYGNTCYNTETNIPNNNDNCPYYYPKDSKVKKCVSQISDCQSAEFNYIIYNQKECRKNCDDYYKLIDGTNIIKCYENFDIAHSADNDIKFFDKTLKKCWKTFPTGYYIKYENNINGDITYEVVENCDNFYFVTDDSHNECTNNCKNENLFFIQGQSKCESLSSCYTNFNKKYYDETNNECLDTCKGRNNLEYANPFDSTNNEPQKCLEKCSNSKYYISITDSTDSNIITNYECVDSCPTTTTDNTYTYIDVKTNECLISCPTSKYYVDETNKKCYPKCDVANGYIYINGDNYECLQVCPSNLKKMVLILSLDNGKEIYMCKSACEENENVFRLGDKCVDECPEGYNFIGHNNICKYENCNEDPNGEHYYPFKDSSTTTSYKLYKCINSCEDTENIDGLTTPFLYHLKSKPNECLSECPSAGYPYYDDNECVSKCPDEKPFYDNTVASTDPNYNRCKRDNICRTTGDIYFLNGNCYSDCKSQGKYYIDSNNMCLDKCRENEYREYKETNSDNTITYNCIKVCNKYIYQKDIESEIECVPFCPDDKYFVGNNDECKKACEEEDGLNYYEMDFSSLTPPPEHKIYKCTNGCPPERKNKEVNNGNQCYDNSCTENYPYLSEEENLCYDNCLKSGTNTFSLTYYDTDGTTITSQICGKGCDSNTGYKYYGKDKKCIADCEKLGDTKIVNYNNECVEECDLNSEYRFQLNKKCEKGCEQDDPTNPTPTTPPLKMYSKNNYICKDECGQGERIVLNDNECVSSCDGFLNPIIGDTIGDYKCLQSCIGDYKFYYENEKKCLLYCNDGDKAVEEKNICIRSCDDLLTDKKYYLYKKDVSSTDDYDKCVLNCPDNKPYINQDECIRQCPSEKKYFVKEFVHGESDSESHQKCLTDCPEDYPYYKVSQDLEGNNLYECQAECEGYYVPSGDDLITAKLCLDGCPSGDYKYQHIYEIEGKTKKECYENCPTKWKYYFQYTTYDDTNTDINCYEECPENAPYHEKGKNICKKQSELTGGYILYDIKEWIPSTSLDKCPNEYKLYSQTEDATPITICLNECNYSYNNEQYYYLTPYNTCVKNCESTTSPLVQGKYLKNDEENKKCICKKLYHYDEATLLIKCYPDTYTNCKDTKNPNYPLPLHGSNQCLKTCSDERILNPSENDCYPKNTPCSQIDPNSAIKTKNDGILKCECSYNFYMDSDGITKNCLAENDLCPQNKPYLITETKECVAECSSPYSYYFKNYCVKNCPSGTTVQEGTTTCNCDNKFWYQSSTENFVCLVGNCLDDYPVYIKDTKQCLKTCKGSHYPNLFNNICYKDCTEDSTGIANIEPVPITSDLAEFKCDCIRPWYYDINANHESVMSCPVNDGNIKKCRDYTEVISDFKLLYMIPSTKQCVENCPPELPYYFNEKCYENCNFDINIEAVENSYECRCQNLWYIDPDDEYELDKICYNKDQNECDIRYDDQQKNTRYLINSTKECVVTYKDCPEKSFKFNSICYDKCPEYTLESTEEIVEGEDTITINICTCDKNYLWLFYIKYGNRYYKCGLDSCPETPEEDDYIRKNLLENQNQCVKSCTDDGPEDNEYKYSFRNICVKECPQGTKQEYDECKFIDIKDKEIIDDLYKLKDSANIQAKELYDKSEQMSGYIMHDFDASLQIYAMNKLDTNKELIMKNNLTYIDPGKCLERIYEDNGLEDDDKIIVAKYDLLTRNHKSNNNNNNNDEENDNNDNNEEGNNNDGEEGNNGNNNDNNNNNNNNNEENIDNKYLINQVEYEFFIYSTMEKIEGVCLPNEIEISYPIVSNKNNFNNYESGVNDNDYLKKFNIGKLLHNKDPEIDTFNKENKIYKDICIGVELNGKDLVLEERYNYLYPNNISLCESNCTMKNTDFDLERINCMCTFKEIFDFNRIDEDTNNILNDPNFPLPTQSGGNAQIIKCLSKLGIKEGITKNEAFYYCAAGSVIILSMALVSAIHGVKSVGTFMNGMLGNTGGGVGTKNNVVNSTSKFVNNPPKKNDEYENDEMDENEENEEDEKKEENIEKEVNRTNIVIKKNIKMQYNINNNTNNNSKNDVSEISVVNNKNINYGVNTKNNFTRNKNKTYEIEEKNNNTKANTKYNTINIYSNKKAEFIPPEYNFKFFKPNDKGIVKRIERSQIPFEVDKDTKILLEGKQDVLYDENYLKGPFYEDQNILEIIEDNNIITNKNTKVVKFSDNNNPNNTQVINKKRNIYNLNNNQDSNSPKKNNLPNNLNSDEKEFIKIKKINPITSLQMTVEEYKTDDEIKVVDSTTSIYNLMKREHTYLRATYEKYMSKNHPNILATFLAEILDKIYLIKIFIFLKKFEIFSIQLSLYIFYHILVLSLLCGFFTIKTIKRIWEEYDYPTINFYLLYGFLAHVIIWVIYRIFILLLDNQDKIRALVSFNNNNRNNNINNEINNNNKDEIIKEKYDDLMKKIKIQTAVFYIVIIIITAFCFIYLVTFFAIYTGTKAKVFKAYYISLIEIVLIKFIYGLCLASFRIAAEGNELKSLYNFVYVLDKYLS